MRSSSIWPGVVFTVAVVVASCGQVASTIFDLPRKPQPVPAAAPAPTQPPSGAAAAVESAPRRPIEATLNPDSVLALLPRDTAGDVDWVAALRGGVIRPRPALPRSDPPPDMSGFGFDFLIKGPDPTFDARFPHSAHVEWMSCATCHPRIFPYPGAPITMDAVNQGEACGRCQGKVAFAATNCYRCHPALPPDAVTPTLGGDLTLARRADSSTTAIAGLPRGRFGHWVHRIRYRCMACHPALFATQAGADTLTMDAMTRGTACGKCHDGSTAFGLFECNRCHVPAEAARDTVR